MVRHALLLGIGLAAYATGAAAATCTDKPDILIGYQTGLEWQQTDDDHATSAQRTTAGLIAVTAAEVDAEDGVRPICDGFTIEFTQLLNAAVKARPDLVISVERQIRMMVSRQ